MTGIVTLSIELELGWGMHDMRRYDHLSRNREAENRALERLLSIADDLELLITFSVVGHLFHHSCSGTHPGPHPEEWWDEDPGTDVETDPLFYSPGLISDINNAKTNHEIATHTYSHLLADEAPNDELSDEISKVRELHHEFGLHEPESIVLPRHQTPNYSVLAEGGIRTIRKTMEEYRRSSLNPIAKTWWLLTREHPTSTIRQRAGLLETTVTPHPSLTSVLLPAGQSSSHPVFSALPLKLRQSLHQRYLANAIDRATEDDSHVHLWTHLYNFANDAQWEPMRGGLEYLSNQRNEGGIEIQRMQDLTCDSLN